MHNATHNMYMHFHVYLVSVHIDIHNTHGTFLICTEFIMMCTWSAKHHTHIYMYLHVYLVSVHIDIHSTHDTFLICTEFVRMYTFIYTSISYLSFLCFSFCTDRIGFQANRDKDFTFFVLLLKKTIVRLN